MNYRVAIGPSSFGEKNITPIKMLQDAGFEIINNPYRRRLTELEIIDHISNVDGLIAGLERLSNNVLETAKHRLKAIARVGIGISNVDVAAANRLGIKVSNTPEGPTEAVSEMTIGALLNCTRHISFMSDSVRSGEWNKIIGLSLSEMTILIIGYGRIGKRVSELLKPFGCNIIIHDPFLGDRDNDGITWVDLEEGLKIADCITIHASGNQVLLDENEFRLMKKGMILLNSARGELVNEEALANALDKGVVASCWFDSFIIEPYSGILTKYKQAILTPHSATYTRKCRYDMETQAVSNLLHDLAYMNH